MPLTESLIEAAIDRYWRELDRYKKLAGLVGERCRALLEDAGIRGTVHWRAKAPDRLKAKLQKYLERADHATEFVDLDSIFHVLKDLSGVRITTYVETDRLRVVDLIQKHFLGYGVGSAVVAEVKDQPAGFYRATHCIVRLSDDLTVGQHQNLRGLQCEVQICSQLAHVYNEIEHDLRYKPLTGVLSKNEGDLLDALARLMEVGDTIINHTRGMVEARQKERAVSLLRNRRDSAAEIATQFRLHPPLAVVTTSPFLIRLAAVVQARHPRQELPASLVVLYRQMMTLLASGEQLTESPFPTLPIGTEELLGTLGLAAWHLFSLDAELRRFDRARVIDALCAAGHTEAEAESLLPHLVNLGFLLTNSSEGKEYLEFCDGTVRDYLAALHIASRVNQDGWERAETGVWNDHPLAASANVGERLDARAFEPVWELLIVFVAGMLDDPVPLFRNLADRARDDIYRHRLGLACRCYEMLEPGKQTRVTQAIPSIFTDLLRIARRCEHDDPGHRIPWVDYVEKLLSSFAGAGNLVGPLLLLNGRYRGWSVPLKVLELLERTLVKGKVPTLTIDSIAQYAERDEHQWGVNTASLALRLSEADHYRRILARFETVLDDPTVSERVKIRIAEAVAASSDTAAALRSGEMLISYAQDASLAYESSERAATALLCLLETDLAPTAAAILTNLLLNPSSRNHFWLAWRIIGKCEKEPNSPWLTSLVTVTLFADREDDQRLKLWSSQVLATHPQPQLRDLGFQVLKGMADNKHCHSWAYAARWLVEHGPSQFASNARELLLKEAADLESTERHVATAELLETGVVDPLGGPIRREIHKAVARELEEHGRKYGSRLHVSVPGLPKENIDFELFADNPAAVIKLLHTFKGPSPYLRDRDDPNEEERRMRNWMATLLRGTRYWPDVLHNSIEATKESSDPDRDGALSVVLFGASSSQLLELLQKTLHRGYSAASIRHGLLEELNERGWRFRFRGRRIQTLQTGQQDRIYANILAT